MHGVYLDLSLDVSDHTLGLGLVHLIVSKSLKRFDMTRNRKESKERVS